MYKKRSPQIFMFETPGSFMLLADMGIKLTSTRFAEIRVPTSDSECELSIETQTK